MAQRTEPSEARMRRTQTSRVQRTGAGDEQCEKVIGNRTFAVRDPAMWADRPMGLGEDTTTRPGARTPSSREDSGFPVQQPVPARTIPPVPLITFLTDYGLNDSYVAEVKGVLLSRVPDADIVDITHLIPPGDIRSAAYVLGRAWRTFPEGTVHLAVVDPGVGTARAALAVRSHGHTFVGPDNGIFSYVLTCGPFEAVTLETPERPRQPSMAGTSLRPPRRASSWAIRCTCSACRRAPTSCGSRPVRRTTRARWWWAR